MIRISLLLVLATTTGVASVTVAQEDELPGVNSAMSALSSDNGLFTLVVEPGLKPMRLNTIHHWTLKLSDAGSKAVSSARIEVDGGMPGHGHGLPTSPRVSSGQVPGEYRLEGLRFNMSGIWELKLDIHDGERSDRVQFQFVVEDSMGK